MKRSKQVIVMRKDLNMRKGKMIAQGAHASLKVILDNMESYENFQYITSQGLRGEQNKNLKLIPGSPLQDWINGLFTKVCVSVDSEQELLEIYNKAKEAGLLCSLITDAGLTEFNGIPTNTCCAIGPDWSEEIDKITGHLKLL